MIYEVYYNKAGVIGNSLLIVIALFFIVVCLFITDRSVSCDSNIGVVSSLCDDNDDCTYNYATNKNRSCIFYNKPNGSPCDLNEQCYNHSLCTPQCSSCNTGTCDKPRCVGPTSCCQGLCTVDADCVPKVQFLTDSHNSSCLSGVCFYTVYNSQQGTPEQCLNLVNGTMRNCLTATVAETCAYNSICYYSFSCALPTTGQPDVD